MSDYNTNEELPGREEIEDTTDLDTLLDWHEDTVDLLDSIKAQLHAYKLTDNNDAEQEAWAFRAGAKAGYVGTTLRRIERRIVTLGGPLPLTVDRLERETIGKLKYRIRALEHLLRVNGIDTKVNQEDAL